MLTYNQKVVPISKSVKSDLNHSPVWQRAKRDGQPFLYFKGESEYEDIYLCHHTKESPLSGDYFLLCDLAPYTY
ncbi:hypothetical protein [Brevibacillus laterosporus]|uniref:hypothetical protein n=1 Tax=Brevibacillus laterosporus TaxID=1465 RepID=UPI00215C3A9E|nr:hypothetical protein [Brevibacillus laterosporus]MCR8994580.1 hypothetical protein [Brevibacillus laterosporus]